VDDGAFIQNVIFLEKGSGTSRQSDETEGGVKKKTEPMLLRPRALLVRERKDTGPKISLSKIKLAPAWPAGKKTGKNRLGKLKRSQTASWSKRKGRASTLSLLAREPRAAVGKG